MNINLFIKLYIPKTDERKETILMNSYTHKEKDFKLIVSLSKSISTIHPKFLKLFKCVRYTFLHLNISIFFKVI